MCIYLHTIKCFQETDYEVMWHASKSASLYTVNVLKIQPYLNAKIVYRCYFLQLDLQCLILMEYSRWKHLDYDNNFFSCSRALMSVIVVCFLKTRNCYPCRVTFDVANARFSFIYSFEFRLRVSLSSDGNLSLISRIRNVNGKPYSFSFAYHTYFSVSDIRYAILSLSCARIYAQFFSYFLNQVKLFFYIKILYILEQVT